MTIFCGVVGDRDAVCAACDHDRNFFFKWHPRFQHRAWGVEACPNFLGILAAFELDLALAIVAKICGLQHTWAGELLHGGGKVSRAGNQRKLGVGNAVRFKKIFLTLAVLADRDRRR